MSGNNEGESPEMFAQCLACNTMGNNGKPSPRSCIRKTMDGLSAEDSLIKFTKLLSIFSKETDSPDSAASSDGRKWSFSPLPRRKSKTDKKGTGVMY